MIVVKVGLISAVSSERSRTLNCVIIDNIGGTRARRNYRVRAYRKGWKPEHGLNRGVIREAQVLGHRAEAEPVLNLVAKALTAMGYE